MPSQIFDDAGGLFQKYGGQAVDAIVKPIADKLNQQIDKIAYQARQKVALRQNVNPSQVTDLDVAEYIANLPTQQMTGEISQQMQYIGKTTRNGIIIGLGMVAVAILIVGMSKKKA